MQAASPLADLRYISCARRRYTIPSNIEGHPRFSWGHSHSTARRSAFPVPSGNAPPWGIQLDWIPLGRHGNGGQNAYARRP